MTEYQAGVRAIREKTARLKALRLAKEAQAQSVIVPTSIETGLVRSVAVTTKGMALGSCLPKLEHRPQQLGL